VNKGCGNKSFTPHVHRVRAAKEELLNNFSLWQIKQNKIDENYLHYATKTKKASNMIIKLC
jgi:hypothetical protein